MDTIILPQGNNIRQLLVKSTITDASVNSFLKDKGVFLGRTEKNSSVPLLMKTLVSPDDFESLYEIQRSKEESIKHRTTSIKCAQNFELSDILDEPLFLNKAIQDKHTYRPGFSIIGNPGFYFEDSGSAILEYKIERENALNDWTTSKTYHSGSIRIEKADFGLVHVSVQHNSTSKETLEVNSLVIACIKERLAAHSLVSPDDPFMSIRFNDFSNTKRIKFLYSFANDLSIYTKFLSLTDLNLYLDPDVQGHADIESFLAEIENLRLRGKSLHNHVFIKTDKYHNKLLCGSINLKYKLSYEGVHGHMFMSLSFPDYIKSRNELSEFQTEISFSLGNLKNKSSIEKKIRNKMLPIIEKIKMSKFDVFKK